MARLYLVRHGRAEAGFGEASDPGLDERGRKQAEVAAARLAPLGPLAVRTSPLKRAQETAVPLVTLWKREPVIDAAVAEIPSPNMDLAERIEWLRGFMRGSWRDVGPELAAWRETLIADLCAIDRDTVIFSHFVAINVVAGAALDDDRVVVFSPDNCSVTVFDVDGGTLSLVDKGHEAELARVNRGGGMSKEAHELGAAELSDAFDARELSPVEVTQACLGRISALDAEVNAFCHLDEAASLAMAEASEQRWMAGEPLSPLDGVPIAVKDLLLTKGWPTRRGSRTVDPAGPWDDDAPVVARLREAGAVLIGKTTTPEFGWKGSTDSPLTGITRNPWNLAKTPGGSSGGSGAALAARMCPLALGTDGGGSIRIPASFTGTYGLKPSFGRVPAWPLSPFGTLAHVGPMTRTVRDAALLMNAIAQLDARDWYAVPFEPVNYAAELGEGIRGKRIAYSKRLGYVTKIAPEVEVLVEKAVKRFEKMGAIVEEADPPGGDPGKIFRTLWWAGAGYLLGDLPEEKKAQLEKPLRKMAEEGKEIPLKTYMATTLARADYGAKMRQFMESYDFIVTPTTATPAFDTGKLTPLDDDGNAWMAWTPFSYPFNLTQKPAASINCGFTSDGLPVGLQIVGRMLDDAGVLTASAAYEAEDPYFDKMPDGF